MLHMQEAISAAPGSLGGRGAGAGFGGCLVALVEAELVDDFAANVRKGYLARTGIDPSVFPVRAAAGAGEIHFSS
jgi:galactokinase